MVKRALVTGSEGFVGRHFTLHLLTDMYDEIHLIDAVHGDDCRTLFASDAHYDLVIHCAAVVGGRAKIDGAPMSVADNLSIDAALWQWALRTRPGRVVYFSSSAAYPVDLQTGPCPGIVGYFGRPQFQLRESDLGLTDIAHPDQTYGLAKLVGEIQADLVRSEGVPVSVVRPFSGYGEDQALDYPFPSFIDRAHRRADPFDIWGDGTQTRDFIHIDDIVNAVMVMVDEGIDGPVNLCTGRATSFNELAGLVTLAAGYQPAIYHHRGKPTGVAYRVGDPTRLHEFYRPAISLEEGIARALARKIDNQRSKSWTTS